MKRFALRSALALGALLVALVASELGFRLWARDKPEYSRERIAGSSVEDAVGNVAAAGPSARLLHPYLGWIEAPGTPFAAGLSRAELTRQLGSAEIPDWVGAPVNAVGFVEELAPPFERASEDYLVVVVGGSVARRFALQGAAVLEERLGADARLAGRRVRVVNAASAGYKQPQQLFTVAYLWTLGLRPDAVIALDGFNEAAIGLDNAGAEVAPVYPGWGHWTQLVAGVSLSPELVAAIADVELARRRARAARARARRLVGWSHLAGYVFARRAERAEAEGAALLAEYERRLAAEVEGFASAARRGPLVAREAAEAREHVAALWARSSRALAALCEGLGVRYLAVLQPTAHDADAKPLSAVERRVCGSPDHGWARAAREVYPLLRREGAALVEEGVDFVDLSGVFREVEETLYYDLCHYNTRGNELLAEAVAEAFLSR